ncbi:MAG: hypothetical protein KAR17_03255, partial [Cyclobacteriaceae bacterium]|nr:hypothetical protein [Cyclobacteriaceae bacterium]
DHYALVIECDKDYYNEGSNLIKKAISIDPNSQHAWQVLAWANLLDKNKVEYERAARKCLSLNPNNPMYMATIGFGDQCAGEYERGLVLMLESIDLNPFYPWQTNFGLSLYYFQKKTFDEALYWADLVKRPMLIWDPLMRASALGFLNRTKEASRVVNELMAVSPNFHEQAPYIVDRFIIDKELQNTILKGLTLAGIDIK